MFRLPTVTPVDERVLREVMHSTKTGFVGQILVLLFADAVLAGFVPTPLLATWNLLHLLNLYYRGRLIDAYLALPPPRGPDPTERGLYNRYLASLAFTSLLWAGMLFFLRYLPDGYEFLLYTVVVTLTFGSTMSIGPITPVYLLYVLPMNLLLMGMFLLEGDRTHVAAALFLPVALFFSAKAAKMHLLDYTALLLKESDARELKEFFEYRASHDALTGIANRTKLMETLEKAIREKEGPLALIFLDLDRFKAVNDTYGHETGDRVLEIVAKRLRHAVREEDLPARFAGDEFVVLVRGVASEEKLKEIARQIREKIGAPIRLEERTLSITPSIGIALYPQDGSDARTLLRHADMAMYRSKKGRLPFVFGEACRINPS